MVTPVSAPVATDVPSDSRASAARRTFLGCLSAGCVVTIVLYVLMVSIGPRFGLQL